MVDADALIPLRGLAKQMPRGTPTSAPQLNEVGCRSAEPEASIPTAESRLGPPTFVDWTPLSFKGRAAAGEGAAAAKATEPAQRFLVQSPEAVRSTGGSRAEKRRRRGSHKEEPKLTLLDRFQLLDQQLESGCLEGIVYLITNLKTGERYVGATSRSLKTRWKHHRRSKKYLGSPLHRAMVAYGSESFKVEPVISCLDIDALYQLEGYYIREVSPEYNRAIPQDIWGGDGWTLIRRSS